MKKTTRRNRAAHQGTTIPEFLTDPEGAEVLRVGMTRFLELQAAPDFPAPVWFGPRGKRHVREKLISWALAQTERESA